MIGYFRDLRLLPIAMVASACLLALTAADLLLESNFEPTIDAPAVIADTAVVHAGPGGAQPGDRPQSWAQQMFNFPDSKGSQPAPLDLAQSAALSAVLPQIASDKSNADIITGSVGETCDEGEGRSPSLIKPEAPTRRGKPGSRQAGNGCKSRCPGKESAATAA